VAYADLHAHDLDRHSRRCGVRSGDCAQVLVDPIDDRFTNGSGVIAFGNSSAIVTEPTPPPPPPPPPQSVLRVGGNIRPPQRVVDVAPTYPPIALAAAVEGVVILEAVIAEDGSVRDVRVLRSIPLLDTAAVEAVRQWRFTPTLLNGEAVPVVMTVTVAFWPALTDADSAHASDVN